MAHGDSPPRDDQLARDVLDNLLEGCQVIGFDWRYLYVNESAAAQGHSTRERLLGRTMMECYPGIDATPVGGRIARCFQTREHDRMENEFEYPDGSKGVFELRFVPVPEGVCILSLDLTPARRTSAALARSEEQFRQAQKLEAIGRLAGGIAHDFNNMLSVVLGYTTLALGSLRPADPLRDDLEEIRKAGERAADLTRRLLAFGRRQMLEPRRVDLGQTLRGMERMLARVIGEDVRLRTICAPDPNPVLVDPGQVEQALMNLVVNARDAMPEGGMLTIEVSNLTADAEHARLHLGLEPRDYVTLVVTDTGIGMDKETQARIFEPFFTTKAPGVGTGLGLAMVYGFVKQSGGQTFVYSEPGQGSSFRIYLPAIAADCPAAPPETVSETRRLTGTETVLLVEDDDQVRSVARDILRSGGYYVLEARNAGEALLICEDHPQPIHLLLTDVVMPQMSGVQLARRLGQTRPGLRALCMSGYTTESALRHGVTDAGLAFLQKPLTPDRLLRKVRELLDAG